MKNKWIETPKYLKTGDFGENLVKNLYLNKNWSFASHDTADGSHFIDGFATKFIDNNIKIQLIEVKTKPAMDVYPHLTGFDKTHHHFYKELNKKNEVICFFVDSFFGVIFTQKLTILNNYEIHNFKGKVVYPIDKMKIAKYLNYEELNFLLKNEKRRISTKEKIRILNNKNKNLTNIINNKLWKIN